LQAGAPCVRVRACARRCLCLCVCEGRSDRGSGRTSIWSKSRCSDEPGANIEMKTVPTTARQQLHARAGSELTLVTSAPGLGSPLPHLHRDWARRSHICTRTGLAAPTSAPGRAHPSHICTGTGLTPPTSAPGLRSRWYIYSVVLRRLASCRVQAARQSDGELRGSNRRYGPHALWILAGTRGYACGDRGTLLGW
jgi:hypothetical protein